MALLLGWIGVHHDHSIDATSWLHPPPPFFFRTTGCPTLSRSLSNPLNLTPPSRGRGGARIRGHDMSNSLINNVSDTV